MEGIPTNKFDIDAGCLCLDFANTLDWHASDQPQEGLTTYADLVTFGSQAGLLAADEAAYLLSEAQQRPDQAQHWLADAIRLREAMYRVFVAIANAPGACSDPAETDDCGLDGEAIDPADVAIITTFWQQAAQSRRLVAEPGGFHWQWSLQAGDLGRVLWPVVQSTVELLESEQRERIGQCQDDRGCGFLFIDTSRNHTRRWCSMDSCGNRAKAARHHAKAAGHHARGRK